MKKIFLLSFLYLSSALLVAQTKEIPIVVKTTVTSVHDGDTFHALINGEDRRIRFAAIDCPEIDQEFGKEAGDFTRQACLHKEVTLKIIDIDYRKRPVAFVILPDGKILNRELVKAGYAWHYKKYDDDVSLDELQAAAKRNKLGLWAAPDQVAPWQFRYQHSKGIN